MVRSSAAYLHRVCLLLHSKQNTRKKCSRNSFSKEFLPKICEIKVCEAQQLDVTLVKTFSALAKPQYAMKLGDGVSLVTQESHWLPNMAKSLELLLCFDWHSLNCSKVKRGECSSTAKMRFAQISQVHNAQKMGTKPAFLLSDFYRGKKSNL